VKQWAHRWDEIDGDVWSIPAERMKEDKAHTVPLSGRVLEIIKSLPRVSDFVFVSPDGQRSGKQIGRDAFKDTLKALDVNGATAHGFRATFTDWAADRTNYPREVREQCLAHAIESKTEKAYRRGELLDKRHRLMEAWAAFCAGLSEAKGGEVVPLRRA
jgi:integrase